MNEERSDYIKYLVGEAIRKHYADHAMDNDPQYHAQIYALLEMLGFFDAAMEHYDISELYRNEILQRVVWNAVPKPDDAEKRITALAISREALTTNRPDMISELTEVIRKNTGEWLTKEKRIQTLRESNEDT